MKKNDWILVVVIICVAGAWFYVQKANGKKDAGYVTASVDGETYGVYSLSEARNIRINQTNTLSIEGGTAVMKDATCKDKLCVHQKSISHKGESIICLPNKVIVEVTDGKEAKLDAVTN